MRPREKTSLTNGAHGTRMEVSGFLEIAFDKVTLKKDYLPYPQIFFQGHYGKTNILPSSYKKKCFTNVSVIIHGRGLNQ